MSGREWKPGDVAVLTTPDGREFMAVRTGGGSTGDYWSAPKGWPRGSVSDYECAIRPLVVIDPEDDDQIERLAEAYWTERRQDKTRTHALRLALREFANPTPPEPDEPKEVGAQVEAEYRDSMGRGFGPARWARGGDGSWVCLTDGSVGHVVAWPFLANVRVLSEGWSE